jgi:hypothetical protein
MPPDPVASLLRHFHRQRPIRGGSLLITIFGDSIAPRGGAVTLGSLISLAYPFGLTERLVRTSVARLAVDGWLVARRDGRRSEYRITPTGRDRFAGPPGASTARSPTPGAANGPCWSCHRQTAAAGRIFATNYVGSASGR